MYKFREVFCPYCEKKYMLEETSGESVYYRDAAGKRRARL